MKMYKTACNYATKMDLIIKNPFNIYDGRLSVKDTVFLTQQELITIENKIFPTPRLEKVKDIFLFSCYTGYAPVDALELTEKKLICRFKWKFVDCDQQSQNCRSSQCPGTTYR